MKEMITYIAEKVDAGALSPEEAKIINTCMAEYAAMKSVTDATYRNRYFFLVTLTKIFHDTGITLIDCNTSHILQVVTAIKKQGYSDNYQRLLVSLLKWFAGFLGPGIDMNKIRSIDLPKLQWKSKRPEDMLSKEEVMRVLAACDNSRDRCLISMIYDGSNRIVEPLSLDWKDLMHDDMGYYIDTKAKTGRQRKIRYTSSIPHIEQWQKDYPGKAEGSNPVFISLHEPRNRMTKGAFDKRIKEIKEKTGIQKLKPGIMRSTRITHDVAAGQDVQYIMLKNWGNLKTSMLDKYTNLSGDYIDSKAMEYAGLKIVDKAKVVDPMQPVQCPKCFTINEPGNKHCRECGKALTKEGEDELGRIRDAMTPEEWIQFWQWKKDHP